jgi:hypothetical protein
VELLVVGVKAAPSWAKPPVASAAALLVASAFDGGSSWAMASVGQVVIVCSADAYWVSQAGDRDLIRRQGRRGPLVASAMQPSRAVSAVIRAWSDVVASC